MDRDEIREIVERTMNVTLELRALRASQKKIAHKHTRTLVSERDFYKGFRKGWGRSFDHVKYVLQHLGYEIDPVDLEILTETIRRLALAYTERFLVVKQPTVPVSLVGLFEEFDNLTAPVELHAKRITEKLKEGLKKGTI